jgi:UDP-glucose 4-epimerase
LTEDLLPKPTDAYGDSKLAPEQELARIDLDWVALRLALVFGPGVKGNMADLIRLARSPLPLPLRTLRARRSLLSLDNLVAAVLVVAATPQPLRRPLIVADPAPLNVAQMITAMRAGLGLGLAFSTSRSRCWPGVSNLPAARCFTEDLPSRSSQIRPDY